MPDLFEFMLGKKEAKKKPEPTYDDKNNYSIYMPVGIYDGSEEEDDYIKNKNIDLNKEESLYEPIGRRGDFNPYSMEKMKSEDQLMELKRQITAMEDEIKTLRDKINDLKNENSAVSVEKSRYQYIGSTYRNMIEKIVKIMPYYQEIEFTGIGSPEQWTDRKLVEVFVSCIENIKIEYSNKLKEIEQLKASRPVVSDSSIPEIPNIDDLMGGTENADEPLSVDDLNDLNQSIDIFNPNADSNANVASGGFESSFDTEHLNRYIDKVNEDYQLKVILETIGETGLSRVTELKDTDSFKRTFVNSNGEFTQGALSKKIQVLDDLDIVDVEKITTGRKGGYENIYSLSEMGIQMYRKMFATNPVESEKFAIKRQHTSLEHGYFIKTVAKELENKGYEVFDSPEDCVRKPLMSLEDGDDKLRVEADLIINKSDTEYIIECEMGTTSDSDMNKKLDKLILVTNVISFIMNNQDSLNKTSAKVDKWITKKGRENLKGYTFRFTTLDTLKKKEVWQNKGPF